MTTPDRPPALASLSRLHLLRLALSESLRTTGHYLWRGWGSIAAICLFLMMTMLAISNSPEGFVTSSLAILATSVITGTSVYWAMQRRR